jgi:uncharacterized protein
MHIEYTIQTNSTLLNDAWCAFLREHNFMVGLGIEGPLSLHDAYRPVTAAGLAAYRD